MQATAARSNFNAAQSNPEASAKEPVRHAFRQALGPMVTQNLRDSIVATTPALSPNRIQFWTWRLNQDFFRPLSTWPSQVNSTSDDLSTGGPNPPAAPGKRTSIPTLALTGAI